MDMSHGQVNMGYKVLDQHGQEMQVNAFATQWTSTDASVSHLDAFNGLDMILHADDMGSATLTGTVGNAVATINVAVTN